MNPIAVLFTGPFLVAVSLLVGLWALLLARSRIQPQVIPYLRVVQVLLGVFMLALLLPFIESLIKPPSEWNSLNVRSFPVFPVFLAMIVFWTFAHKRYMRIHERSGRPRDSQSHLPYDREEY